MPEDLNKKTEDRLDAHGKLISQLNWLLFAVVLLLIAAVGGMFATTATLVWNSNMWGVNTYQTLIKDLDDNNDKIEVLIDKVIDLRVQYILNHSQ